MQKIFHRLKDPDLSKMWVILVVSNPVRYISRYDLLHRVLHQYAGVNILIVETAFGDRDFEVTSSECRTHLQIRTFDELWHKENMINRGIEYLSVLDPKWEYVCWIDADVIFQRPDILHETWHELQHHHVVQMFQTAIDLGPHGETFKVHNGFAWNYIRGVYDNSPCSGYGYGKLGHTGFAWAARREALDFCGGLIDIAILGAGDHHMAMGLIGKMASSVPKEMSESYKQMLLIWEDRCEKYIKRDIGFVHGTLLHLWHGRKRNRFYQERWKILTDHKYCPLRDLRRDTHGVWNLAPDRIELRDAIRKYFRSRDEDDMGND